MVFFHENQAENTLLGDLSYGIPIPNTVSKG